MAFEKLRILIDADAKGAVREIDRLGTSAERSLGKANSKLDTFANGSIKLGTAMIGASVAVGYGLAKTVGAAQEAEVAQIKLANSVKNSSNVSKGAVGAFNQQALALQRVTTASDEEVNAAQAMLVQFGATKSEVLKLTPLVVDLSKKMGVDTVTAAKAVGKTLDGNSGALKRMGVRVDEAAFANDKFGATFAALQTAAGGFAEKEGKTLSGQLTILRNQFGELEESVGRGVVGVLKDILPAAQSAVDGLGSIDDATGGAVGKIAALTVGIGLVGGSISLLAGAAIKVRGGLLIAYEAVTGLGGGITTLVGKLATGRVAMQGFGATAEATGAQVAGAQSGMLGLGTAATAILAPLAATNLIAGGALTDFSTRSEEAKKAAKGWAATVVESSKRVTGGLGQARDASAKLGDAQDKLNARSELLGRSLNNNTWQKYGSSIQDVQRKSQDLANRADDLKGKQQALNEAIKSSASSHNNAASATDRHAKATKDDTAAVEENKTTLDARRTALLASFDSSVGAAEAERSLAETIKTSNDPLDRRSALLSAAAARAKQLTDEYETQTGVAADAEQQQKFYGQALSELGGKYPELQALIQPYIDKLNAQQVKLQWMIDHPKIAQYYEFRANMGPIDSVINKLGLIGVLIGRAKFLGALNLFDGKLASGGPVQRGKTYLVGEQGPEIFQPSSSGRILNARDSAASLKAVGSNGGGNSYSITIATPVVTAETGRVLVDHIRAYERTSGSRWRQN